MTPTQFAASILEFLSNHDIFIVDNALPDRTCKQAATDLIRILELYPEDQDVAVCVTDGDALLVYRKSCFEKYKDLILHIGN